MDRACNVKSSRVSSSTRWPLQFTYQCGWYYFFLFVLCLLPPIAYMPNWFNFWCGYFCVNHYIVCVLSSFIDLSLSCQFFSSSAILTYDTPIGLFLLQCSGFFSFILSNFYLFYEWNRYGSTLTGWARYHFYVWQIKPECYISSCSCAIFSIESENFLLFYLSLSLPRIRTHTHTHQ